MSIKLEFISKEQENIISDNSRIKIVNGAAGAHKCLGKDTPILMFDGTIKLVQDIKVGDQIMGDDSTPRNILEVCSGQDNLYEINNEKNEKYVVNSNHILSLKYSNKKRFVHRPERHSYQVQWFDKKRVSKSFHYEKMEQHKVMMEAKNFYDNIKENSCIDINLQDYIKLTPSYKKYLKGYKVKVDFEEKPLPLDPYMLGVWLGDGSKNGSKITNQDATILKYFSTNLPKINCYMTYLDRYDYYIASTEKSNYFTNSLRNLNLIKNKHIPNIYKINSRENRLKLLAGIIDSDGNYKGGTFRISQKSEKLFDDIVFLCQSLGFACHKKGSFSSVWYKGEKKEGYYYYASISGDGIEEIPTLIKRKQALPRKQIKDVLVSGIKIKELGKGNYYGFEVDGNRRFLLGNFTVTHNTSTLIKCGIRYLMEGKNVLFLTKISSVTDEITKRMTKDYSLVFQKSASHFIGKLAIQQIENNELCKIEQVSNFGWCSVANYDSFIDKQLRKYKIPFEGEAFNQKVRQLHANLDKMDDGLVMKNDEKVDVILIDEVQDFDKLRVCFTTDLFNHFKNLIGVFVGDTLQTVFLQSIMDDSFSMNYLKSNLKCKYFELSKCYRCPKAQIDLVNKIMKPYQEKYCIKPMGSHNHNMIDKAVIFQHHSVHKEYERADLCNRVIYLIDYVLNNDSSINPDDIVVVMNKTNSNAVFEKLLVEVNTYYKKRYKCKNYEHVIHYKTKNGEGRKTIDWSVGEEKTKFISIHGIKGKGQKVVILLGMSEKSIPLVEWLFKTEELISQSVMNVALTRSEKYLFIGVNSIPSRYINDQLPSIQENKLAYCTWDNETYNSEETDLFYKNLLTGFEKFEKFEFIQDKYTKEIVSTPSKSILAIKDDIVQEYHISDCIANAFQLTSDEIMNKHKFGKRMFMNNDMNIVERAILGIMCELLVQRYVRLSTGNLEHDNKFLLNYWNKNNENTNDDSVFYFTNNQSLLNLAFDLKINSDVKIPGKWFTKFEIIKQKSKHIKVLKADLSKIKSPMYILDKTFERINIKKLLDEYFSKLPNEKINSQIFWNLALFFSALSGHYKMASVMLYMNAFNKDISALHENTKYYCDNYLLGDKLKEYSLQFQKEINVFKNVSDPEILSVINPEILKQELFKTKIVKNKETNKVESTEVAVKQKYTYGFMGISDIIQEKINDNHAILHEIKCISMSDSAKVKTWIFQSVLYTYLLKKLNKKTQNSVDKIIIVNLMSGYLWEFDMTKVSIKYRDMITYIMKEKHFPQILIDQFLQQIN